MQQIAVPRAQQGNCFCGGGRSPNIIKGLQERAGYSPKRMATRHVRPFQRTACHAGTIEFPIHHERGKVDSCVRLWPRLCENSPNFVADGTATHIGYKGVSDGILISHVGIGKSREPVQFTTGSCRFAFSHCLCATSADLDAMMHRVQCATAKEMEVGPPKSACRCRLQSTSRCCGQKPRW